MSSLVRAKPHVSRCTAASSPHPAAATSAWTASKDRAAATQTSPQREPHHHHVADPGSQPESRTEISMGTRAHTPTTPTTFINPEGALTRPQPHR
jgi:hypothetical protein